MRQPLDQFQPVELILVPGIPLLAHPTSEAIPVRGAPLTAQLPLEEIQTHGDRATIPTIGDRAAAKTTGEITTPVRVPSAAVAAAAAATATATSADPTEVPTKSGRTIDDRVIEIVINWNSVKSLIS